MVDKIRLYGDPVLRKVSEPVTEIDDETRDLFDRLVATVEDAGGLGLACMPGECHHVSIGSIRQYRKYTRLLRKRV